MIFAVVLFVAAVVWRLLSGIPHVNDFAWIHNFAPLSAIALCGAAFLPRRLAFVLPLGALLLSDVILNSIIGWPLVTIEMAGRYVALAGIVGLGLFLRRSPGLGLMLGASVVASVAFYLVSNTASWITDVGYAKTYAGWIQALTTGLPGYPSTLSFYRNTLIGDMLFTGLFVLCLRVAATRQANVAEAVPAQ